MQIIIANGLIHPKKIVALFNLFIKTVKMYLSFQLIRIFILHLPLQESDREQWDPKTGLQV